MKSEKERYRKVGKQYRYRYCEPPWSSLKTIFSIWFVGVVILFFVWGGIQRCTVRRKWRRNAIPLKSLNSFLLCRDCSRTWWGYVRRIWAGRNTEIKIIHTIRRCQCNRCRIPTYPTTPSKFFKKCCTGTSFFSHVGSTGTVPTCLHLSNHLIRMLYPYLFKIPSLIVASNPSLYIFPILVSASFLHQLPFLHKPPVMIGPPLASAPFFYYVALLLASGPFMNQTYSCNPSLLASAPFLPQLFSCFGSFLASAPFLLQLPSCFSSFLASAPFLHQLPYSSSSLLASVPLLLQHPSCIKSPCISHPLALAAFLPHPASWNLSPFLCNCISSYVHASCICLALHHLPLQLNLPPLPPHRPIRKLDVT